MQLIGISGKMGSGKDTLYSIISNRFPGYENKKFAYKVKLTACMLTGLPMLVFEKPMYKNYPLSDWGMTVREFLQKLGTDCIRKQLHPNAWVKALFADFTEESLWVITDVRFPNEAQAIIDRGGILIRVVRDGIPTSDHESETALDNWEFEHVITNNGSLEDLEIKVMQILTKEINAVH